LPNIGPISQYLGHFFKTLHTVITTAVYGWTENHLSLLWHKMIQLQSVFVGWQPLLVL